MEEKNKVDEHSIRIQKISELRNQGYEPWPQVKLVTATCLQVIDGYKQHGARKKEYTIAGRMMSMREHGKTIFGHIQDRSGKIQIYVRKDIVGDELFLP